MPDRYHEAGKRLDEWEQTAKAAAELAGSPVWTARHDGDGMYAALWSGDVQAALDRYDASCSEVDWPYGDDERTSPLEGTDMDPPIADHMATFDPATMLRLIRALRHLIATARPRDTDRIIDAILGPEDGQ